MGFLNVASFAAGLVVSAGAIESSGDGAFPRTVSIAIVNATIGPARIDGKSWDCCKHVPAGTLATIAKLMLSATAPDGAILALVSGPALAGVSAPDPYGWGEVAIDGDFVPNLTHNFYPRGQSGRDTFTPTFPEFDWKALPLNHGTRLRVTLFDKDLGAKRDDIGVAEINCQDLLAALRSEKIYQVKVGDQTHNQLLFIGISVRATGRK